MILVWSSVHTNDHNSNMIMYRTTLSIFLLLGLTIIQAYPNSPVEIDEPEIEDQPAIPDENYDEDDIRTLLTDDLGFHEEPIEDELWYPDVTDDVLPLELEQEDSDLLEETDEEGEEDIREKRDVSSTTVMTRDQIVKFLQGLRGFKPVQSSMISSTTKEGSMNNLNMQYKPPQQPYQPSQQTVQSVSSTKIPSSVTGKAIRISAQSADQAKVLHLINLLSKLRGIGNIGISGGVQTMPAKTTTTFNRYTSGSSEKNTEEAIRQLFGKQTEEKQETDEEAKKVYLTNYLKQIGGTSGIISTLKSLYGNQVNFATNSNGKVDFGRIIKPIVRFVTVMRTSKGNPWDNFLQNIRPGVSQGNIFATIREQIENENNRQVMLITRLKKLRGVISGNKCFRTTYKLSE